MRDHGRGTLRLPRLVATVAESNEPSRRMILRLGFDMIERVAGPRCPLRLYRLCLSRHYVTGSDRE